MEDKELIYNFMHTLTNPVILLEEKEDTYSIIYANETMKNLLSTDDSQTLKLTDDFLNLLTSNKDKELPNYEISHNIEIFNKFYNINYLKNSNHIFMTFMETNIEALFDNLSFNDMGIACSAMVVVLSDKGKVVDTNECFLKFVGMDKEEVSDKDFFQTFIPAEIERLHHYFEKLLSDNSKNQHFITSLKDIDQNIHKINWQVSKIEKLHQSFIIAIGSDITQLVEQNYNIKREIKSIKVGFEHFPFAVAYMDSKGIFTTMNKNFIKMFHIKDENKNITFDQIHFLQKHIGFTKMTEHISLLKEMTYKINYPTKDKVINIKVNIRMLKGKKESSVLYIVVAQKIM